MHKPTLNLKSGYTAAAKLSSGPSASGIAQAGGGQNA